MPNLNIRINSRSGETKTAQIFNQISSAILAGKFGPGDSIISERALAEQLGVSRNIVRNAYRRLEEAGLLETSSTSNRRVRAQGGRGASRSGGAAGVSRRDRLAADAAGKSASRRPNGKRPASKKAPRRGRV
jgi:DNA-binding transcriptional regulator YhcF (GntR family)